MEHMQWIVLLAQQTSASSESFSESFSWSSWIVGPGLLATLGLASFGLLVRHMNRSEDKMMGQIGELSQKLTTLQTDLSSLTTKTAETNVHIEYLRGTATGTRDVLATLRTTIDGNTSAVADLRGTLAEQQRRREDLSSELVEGLQRYPNLRRFYPGGIAIIPGAIFLDDPYDEPGPKETRG